MEYQRLKKENKSTSSDFIDYEIMLDSGLIDNSTYMSMIYSEYVQEHGRILDYIGVDDACWPKREREKSV